MDNTHKSEHLQGALIDLATSVGDDTDHDFLPAFRTPHLGLVTTAQVSNVLDNAMRTHHWYASMNATLHTHAFMVRQKSTSSSLYMVMTMNSSVWRPYR